jgi:chemotaxis protein CheD
MAIMEIFLQPGEWYFGDRDTRIRTLLGSCIAITLWHPRLLVGGMCHFMLPERGSVRPTDTALDGRYGDEAVAALVQELRQQRTQPREYICKIFGGGNMFRQQPARLPMSSRSPDHNAHGIFRETDTCADVPCKNVRAARSLVSAAGFRVTASHLGGQGHRNLYFEIWTGAVYLKFSGHGATIHETP